MSAGSFTDRMHRKHWSPDIHSSNTNLGKEWANGGAASPGKKMGALVQLPMDI